MRPKFRICRAFRAADRSPLGLKARWPPVFDEQANMTDHRRAARHAAVGIAASRER